MMRKSRCTELKQCSNHYTPSNCIAAAQVCLSAHYVLCDGVTNYDRFLYAALFNLHISLFENIGDYPDMWCVVGEFSPFRIAILRSECRLGNLQPYS